MLTLVIGGAASGKSAYAEHLTVQSGGPRYYLATMQVWDAECAARTALFLTLNVLLHHPRSCPRWRI